MPISALADEQEFSEEIEIIEIKFHLLWSETLTYIIENVGWPIVSFD